MKKLLVLAWAGAALLSGGMLRAENILLSTRNSSLLLTAEKGKTPLFQYFGARVASPDDILASGAAFGDAAYPQFGAQCYREVAIQATHGDGSMSLELAVESVSRDRRDGSETTAIAMKDKHYPFFVTLFYKTYDDCEVIETWTEISHTEKKPVTLYRFASAYMPVRRGDTWLTHFHGTWGAECYLHEEPLTDGMKVLKNKDGVIARIHEAAKYLPLDRLCLSPQCGFASCEIGNKLTEAQQWAKLALVKEIAEEVWG